MLLPKGDLMELIGSMDYHGAAIFLVVDVIWVGSCDDGAMTRGGAAGALPRYRVKESDS